MIFRVRRHSSLNCCRLGRSVIAAYALTDLPSTTPCMLGFLLIPGTFYHLYITVQFVCYMRSTTNVMHYMSHYCLVFFCCVVENQTFLIPDSCSMICKFNPVSDDGISWQLEDKIMTNIEATSNVSFLLSHISPAGSYEKIWRQNLPPLAFLVQ